MGRRKHLRIAAEDWQRGVARFTQHIDRDPQEVRRAQAPPLVLLPGVWERWESTWEWAQALHGSGFDVHFAPDLDLELGSLEELAGRLLDWLASTGLERPILTAHSKGGLVGKQALVNRPQALKGLIACGTPFEGAPLAGLTPPALRMYNLRPSSPEIRSLQENVEANRRIILIEAQYDQNVPRVSRLPGAIRQVVPTAGHNSLLQDPATIRKIVAAAQHIQKRW